MEDQTQDQELTCWDNPTSFVVGLQLRTRDGLVYPPDELRVTIDTGYDGGLLVPFELYAELGLFKWERPEEDWALGETVAGQTVVLPAADAEVLIPALGIAIPVMVETFWDNQAFLVGLQFMRRYKWLLDGPADRTCLLSG
ncbi:MAG: hypothetical protein ACE5F6_11255 [Anaerolineae bacterium]